MADINFNPALLNPNITLASQILGQQTGQANIANTNAATQGQLLQNQRTAFQNQFLPQLLAQAQHYMQQGAQTSPQEQQAQDQSGVDEAPTLSGPGAHIDGAKVEGMVTSKYQQRPYIPSAQVGGIAMMANAAGMKDYGDGIMAMDKAAWDRQQQNRQVGAQSLLKDVYKLQDAVQAGNGIAQLQDIDKAAADSLRAKAQALGWDDKTLNAHVGEWAEAVGGAVYRHTGNKTEFQNNVPYDTVNGRPAPGGEQAAPTIQAHNELVKSWSALVPVHNSDGSTSDVPAYKVAGFRSAELAASSGQPPSSAPQTPQAPGTAQPAPKAAAPSGAAPAPSNAAVKSPVQGVTDDAFADKDFRKPTATVKSGVSQSPEQLARAQQEVKNEQNLRESVQTQAGISATLKPYLDIAQHYIESGGVITGWGAEERLNLAKLAQAAHVDPSFLGDPTKTAIVIKNLGNAALQGARATYGSRMSTNEVALQLQKLSANTDQPAEAIKTLIHEAQSAAQYDSDTLSLSRAYLRAGNDPEAFQDWQNKYHNRADFMTKQTEAAGPKTAVTAAAPQVLNAADYAKIAPGASYRDPAGNIRTKPKQGG